METTDRRSRRDLGIAALGLALAIALLPIPAAALGDTAGASSHPPFASSLPPSASAPDATLFAGFPTASPAQLEDRSGYDSSYLFSLSRSLADSTVVTPLKPPLFIFTIPLDIALLPFAAMAGFF